MGSFEVEDDVKVCSSDDDDDGQEMFTQWGLSRDGESPLGQLYTFGNVWLYLYLFLLKFLILHIF